MISVDKLNQLSVEDFVSTIGGVYEHSPWVVEAIVQQRPFNSWRELQTAMREVVDNSDEEVRLALLRAHPEFAGKAATRGDLTDASRKEQGSLSLNRLPRDQHRHMQELNAQFMSKFGFPGIVAVRKQNSVDDIFALLEKRVNNDVAAEIRDAITQVHLIAECRLQDLIEQ